MEELDNPGEFFFDKKASKLYLYHNGTCRAPFNFTPMGVNSISLSISARVPRGPYVW